MKHLVTFVLGFLIGVAVMFGGIVSITHPSPATPVIRPPTAIKVTLYPWEGVGGIDGEPVDIPPDKMAFAFRRLVPEKYFGGTVYDFITRIVAEAVITHADGSHTLVMVRDHGHNPAVVSIDGRNYFYARNDPDVYAGATELIRLVTEVASAKKGDGRPKP